MLRRNIHMGISILPKIMEFKISKMYEHAELVTSYSNTRTSLNLASIDAKFKFIIYSAVISPNGRYISTYFAGVDISNIGAPIIHFAASPNEYGCDIELPPNITIFTIDGTMLNYAYNVASLYGNDMIGFY